MGRRRPELCLPALSQTLFELLLEFGRNRIRFAILVKIDRLTDVVHDDLTRVTARKVLGVFLAGGGKLLAIDFGVPVQADEFNDSGGKFNFNVGYKF